MLGIIFGITSQMAQSYLTALFHGSLDLRRNKNESRKEAEPIQQYDEVYMCRHSVFRRG
jgi:hypothetical protein